MSEQDIEISFRVTPRGLLWGLAGLLLCASVIELSTETVTVSTYYPAPSGVYNRIITTGDAFLARDGGRVGIGTTNPAATLDVIGSLRIADGAQAPGKILISDAGGMAGWQTPSGMFGGIFYTADTPTGTCLSGNPTLVPGGQCQCPPGFSDSSFRLFTGSGYQWSAGYTCYVPCMGQFVYLHQCSKS